MNTINDGHYIELMDRLSIQISVLEEYCLNHPLAERNTNIKNHIETAMNELGKAYQLVGHPDWIKP